VAVKPPVKAIGISMKPALRGVPVNPAVGLGAPLSAAVKALRGMAVKPAIKALRGVPVQPAVKALAGVVAVNPEAAVTAAPAVDHQSECWESHRHGFTASANSIALPE
jgi:hypothetical protein